MIINNRVAAKKRELEDKEDEWEDLKEHHVDAEK
jgi:hypothetical protein